MRACSSLFALLAAFSLGIAACGTNDDPPAIDSQSVALAAKTNLSDVIGRLVAAAGFLGDSDLLEGLLPDFGMDCSKPPPPRHGGFGGGDGDDWADDEWEDDCDGFDLDVSAEELGEWLSQRVFVDGNLESSSGGVLVYRLRSSITCDRDDESCRDLLDRVAIRLRVSSPVAGDLLIGLKIEGHQPLTFQLLREELSVEVDLAALQASLRALDGVSPRPMPTPGGQGFPLLDDDDEGGIVSMSGKVALSVISLAQDRFELRFSVLESVDLVTGGPEGVSLEVARAAPAFTAIVDGASRSVSLEASLGAADFAGPAWALDFRDVAIDCYDDDPDCLEETEELEGRIALHLGGLRGTTTLQVGPGADVLQLLGFGLGDTTSSVTLDGAPLVSLDLNANHGRQVDLTIARDRNGFTTLQATPALEIELGLQFSNLVNQAAVDPWLLDEHLVFRLDGAPSPKIRFRDGYIEGHGGSSPDGEDFEEVVVEVPASLEVLAGKLTLESNALPSIEVAAGMCLLGFDEEPMIEEDDASDPFGSTEHPFDGLHAGACE